MLVILDKLNFYLSKFWGFLKPRRKLGLVSFVILASLVLVVWVATTNVVHADSVADAIVGWIIKLILVIAGWFLKLTFFILKFVIEVGGYNGFIDSPAVTVGWVMVRDVTNMFFVVVLLIISFGTILGLEQYEYKKLLVKLLIAAVVVNFSRIICGIIIDVAQVVMVTFVNGIAATASGNLVSMFNIGGILKLTDNSAGAGSTSETFLAAVAAITFASMMMMTMLTFLFLLLARMVMLWILIVLSPFAFVLNVLPQTQRYAGDWWKQFGGNVVAGPIVAFFLWLSFVTVGAGNAHDSIKAGSATPIVEGTDPRETQTGLTDVMTWASMANFAIAIGMMLAGAKMAQELGAAGGGMMGKAGEFGKKVAMTASGITTARWAARGVGRGAKAAGKFLAMKAPIVGGEKWIARGKTIAGAAGIGWGKIKGVRNKAAIALEKSGKERQDLKVQLRAGKITQSEFDAAIKEKKLGGGFAAVGRGVRGLLAGVVETGGRRDKRANDWLEAAKNQEKIVEESYSTSSSLSGRMKTELGVRAEQATALSEAKKAKKYGEKKEELLHTEKDGEFGKKARTIAETMAAGEYGKQKGEDKKLIEVAKAKDTVAEANNEETGYEIAARAAIAKRKEDQRASLNFQEITAQSTKFAQKLKEAGAELDRLIADKASEEDINKAQGVVASLGREQMATMTSALNRGSEVGLTAIENAAGVAKFGENIDSSDETGMLRKLFSGLMAKNFKVDMNDITKGTGEDDGVFKARKENEYKKRSLKVAQEAEAEFRRVQGNENANILLRNLDGGLKKTGSTGAPAWTALLNSRDLDSKGRVEYKAEHDSTKAEENRNYFVGANSANQITNLVGLLNSQKGQVTGIDERGMDRFIQIFKNTSRTTKIDPRLSGQFNGMVGSDGQIAGTMGQDMKQLFKKLVEENRQSAAILLSKIGPSFAKALGSEFETLRDREVKSTRKDKGDEDEEKEGAHT